jgi:hypothetical protein
MVINLRFESIIENAEVFLSPQVAHRLFAGDAEVAPVDGIFFGFVIFYQ